MSLSSIEDDPNLPDTTTIDDRPDRPTEDNRAYGDTPHADPRGVAITHLDVRNNRELSQHNADDIAQAFDRAMSGTEALPERIIHDDALQVRQLVPNGAGVTRVGLLSAAAVSVLPRRPERMTAVIKNMGANTAFIAFHANNATPDSGFPLLAGEGIAIEVTAAVNASCVAGSPTTLAVLEQFRTANKGM